MRTLKDLGNGISYDPDTGEGWLLCAGKLNKIGGRWNGKHHYVKVRIEGKAVNFHRLIAEKLLGASAGVVVDHVNNDRRDNRLVNLRVVTPAVNCHKIVPAKRKLPTGVNRAGRGTYFARIGVDGRVIYLGSSNDPDEAHKLYMEAKRRLHGDLATDFLAGELAKVK